jgi:hypothetical protein
MNFTTILNLPIFVSQPHFLNTRPDLSLGVLGLKPSAVLHDTYVDVEPMTGASLNAAKRLMFSTVLNDWWPTLSSSRASSQAPSRQAREARVAGSEEEEGTSGGGGGGSDDFTEGIPPGFLEKCLLKQCLSDWSEGWIVTPSAEQGLLLPQLTPI